MCVDVLVCSDKRETSNTAGRFCQFWVVGRAHGFWIEIFLYFFLPIDTEMEIFYDIFSLNIVLLLYFFLFELNVQVINTKTELMYWIVLGLQTLSVLTLFLSSARGLWLGRARQERSLDVNISRLENVSGL